MSGMVRRKYFGDVTCKLLFTRVKAVFGESWLQVDFREQI